MSEQDRLGAAIKTISEKYLGNVLRAGDTEGILKWSTRLADYATRLAATVAPPLTEDETADLKLAQYEASQAGTTGGAEGNAAYNALIEQAKAGGGSLAEQGARFDESIKQNYLDENGIVGGNVTMSWAELFALGPGE